tara:strand:- start:301 stop:1089 length:789 start_codon:yes stop_codon:yes gene_type:complete
MQNIDKKELLKKIKMLGLKRGDTVYCHNNLSFFFLDEKSINKQKIGETFLKIIMQIIGNDGTLIIPTYTYSFSKLRNGVNFKKKEIFSLQSETQIGFFSNYIVKKKIGLRSEDPFFSCIAIGKKNKEIVKNISNNSFDENSVFSRLLKLNVKFLNFNFNGYTFIHYIERKLKVKYRFDKEFTGFIQKNKKKVNKKWKIFVTSKKSKFRDDHSRLIKFMENKKLIKKIKYKRGEISITDANKIFNSIKYKLKNNKYFLTTFKN